MIIQISNLVHTICFWNKPSSGTAHNLQKKNNPLWSIFDKNMLKVYFFLYKIY